MIVTPNEFLKKELIRLGKRDWVRGFPVRDADRQRFREEVDRLHPNWPNEQKDAWADYSALTHPIAQPPPKEKPPVLVRRFNWAMAWAIGATIIALGLFVARFI